MSNVFKKVMGDIKKQKEKDKQKQPKTLGKLKE
jgi:hypothetical protein